MDHDVVAGLVPLAKEASPGGRLLLATWVLFITFFASEVVLQLYIWWLRKHGGTTSPHSGNEDALTHAASALLQVDPVVTGSALSQLVTVAVNPVPPKHTTNPRVSETRADGVGRVIGKCENFVVFVLVCLGQYEALGLVLAAKSIARMQDMKSNPSYYLAGTLLNFVCSLAGGLVARALVLGF